MTSIIGDITISLDPPEVLGAGTPLFHGVGRHRLTQTSVEVSPVCTHLTYRVAT